MPNQPRHSQPGFDTTPIGSDTITSQADQPTPPTPTPAPPLHPTPIGGSRLSRLRPPGSRPLASYRKEFEQCGRVLRCLSPVGIEWHAIHGIDAIPMARSKRLTALSH